MKLNLTDKPELVARPAAILVYLERIGPFMQTAPKAWPEFWRLASSLDKQQITAMMGLSLVDETHKDGSKNTYQAGVTVKTQPATLPEGLLSRHMPSGRYARYLLTGSYSQLPLAYPHILAALSGEKLNLRHEFCIESYLNSPGDTSEEKLLTEILIPIE